MPDTRTPSIKRDELVERHLLDEDVNKSVINALFNYQNKFGNINVLADFLSLVQTDDEMRGMYEIFLNKVREQKEEAGYIVPRFDLQVIFTPEELIPLRADIAEKVARVNQRVDVINAQPIDDDGMPLICAAWREIQTIMNEPIEGITTSV